MHKLGNSSGYPQPAPQPQYHRSNTGLGSSAFARHYLRNHYCFLFLGVLRCFSSPRSPHAAMYSLHDPEALPPVGFPIRKSPGLSLFSGSPKLIAAYHVLHRLPLPRHPPYALSSLTIKNSKSIYPNILPCRLPAGLVRFETCPYWRLCRSRSYALLQIILYAIVKEQYYRFEVRG